jgi:hypothetical protein
VDLQPIRNGPLLVLLSCNTQREDQISVANSRQKYTFEVKTSRHC